MRSWQYFVQRLILLIPVLVGVCIITFITTRVIPGDPVYLMVDPKEGQEAVERVREHLGLDQPIWVQFYRYVSDIMSGELGTSFRTSHPVLEDLKRRLPATIELALTALLIAVGVGVPLGIMAAVFRDGPWDHMARVFSLFGVSMPQFWLGLLIIFLLFYKLHWLPAPLGRLGIEMTPPEKTTGLLLVDSLLARDMTVFRSALYQIIGPAITLALVTMAALAQIARTSMIEALQSNYILAARAGGLRESTVIFRLALKNAFLPIVTQIGMTIGNLLGGSVLVEYVFAWPGLGQYAIDSIHFLDYPALQGFMLLVAVIYVMVFLITDLAYVGIDPRIR